MATRDAFMKRGVAFMAVARAFMKGGVSFKKGDAPLAATGSPLATEAVALERQRFALGCGHEDVFKKLTRGFTHELGVGAAPCQARRELIIYRSGASADRLNLAHKYGGGLPRRRHGNYKYRDLVNILPLKLRMVIEGLFLSLWVVNCSTSEVHNECSYV
jgi:hypothetical protein